ncbi:MAG: hypothetical protein B6U87_01205 [Candidatus Aenigmarchaeota archaeon ex4484_52]|nr:MAG: hypothetical protein B6U87_01205 [Candidatus Aenigmarchaeota archaeon ex4484_52]
MQEISSSESDTIETQNIEDKIFYSILNDNWRSTLIFLTKDMNIWDIDIKLVFERLSFYIKKIELQNLKVPSSIILLAAIIYNKKTHDLYLKEAISKNKNDNKWDDGTEEEQMNEEWYGDEIGEESQYNEIEKKFIPSIIMPPIRYVKRKLSLDELICSFENIFKTRHKRMKFDFSIPIKDIKQKINETFLLIKQKSKTNKNKEIYFSKLLSGSKEKRLNTFISMLYLINQKKIYCTQGSIYKDIKIKIL